MSTILELYPPIDRDDLAYVLRLALKKTRKQLTKQEKWQLKQWIAIDKMNKITFQLFVDTIKEGRKASRAKLRAAYYAGLHILAGEN
jgi:hypothetical protein